MLRKLRFAVILSLILITVGASAQTGKTDQPTSPTNSTAPSNQKPASIETRIEQYLRRYFAWGPDFQVKAGPIKPSPIPELLEVPVTVTRNTQSDTAVVYVDKNGSFVFRGELDDMSVDPLGDVRSKLHVGNSPSMGPQDAKITLIEFADFECPSCRQLDLILRDLIATHPEVRLVYKNFPLTNIHPWAMTAAIASQCAYEQNPAAFWKIHNAIFDAQEVISPEIAWDKMVELGSQLALNIDTYRACMTGPAATQTVEGTMAEGNALNITATPTLFVNGRKVVGPDRALIEQYMQFEKLTK